MDRLSIDVGPVYTLEILSHQPYYIDTDHGQAPCLRVRSGGQELEWVVARGAYEQLKNLLGSDTWAGKTVRVSKTREGAITRIQVSLDGPASAPESPPPPPAEAAAVTPGVTALVDTQDSPNTVRQILEYERPYSLEVTRGQKGNYGFTLKVRSSSIPELIDELKQALSLIRMVLEDEARLDRNGGER